MPNEIQDFRGIMAKKSYEQPLGDVTVPNIFGADS